MKNYKKILLNLAFFLLGLFLLYVAFRNQDLSEVWSQIQQMHYGWIALIVFISLLNQLVRVARWQLLTQAIKMPIYFWSLFWALMFGFFVNLAVPRLGEFSRCLILKRHEKAEFTSLLGTVVSERAVDVLCLLGVIFLALALQFDLLFDFLYTYLGLPLGALLWKRQWLLGLLLALFLLSCASLWWQRQQIVRSRFGRSALSFLLKLWKGVQSIWIMPQKALFLGYTFLIWFTYFLMTYLWFFTLPATAHLGAIEGLSLLAIGSVARLAPTQGGGLGAYQLLVSKGLLLFGIAELYGIALAIVIHSTQILITLVLGLFSLLYFTYRGSRKQVVMH